MTYLRYVALGDSFTEGVGDPDEARPNGVRGWADRVAEVLGADQPDFGYANLAIRGRKVRGVLEEQVDPALALQPDLVTVYAGGNDILRPAVDLDALVGAYDEALGRIAATGARLLVWTAFDPGGSVFGTTRQRFALYNELVREVVDRRGATLVDFWRMREYRDWRYWDSDRLHMGPAGHQHMAGRVLDLIDVEHHLEPIPLTSDADPAGWRKLRSDAEWTRTFLAPWVHRRLTGRSSGDGLSPRYATLTRI